MTSKLSIGAALLLGSCVPWTVRPLESAKDSPTGATVTSAAAFIESIWSSKLVPLVMNTAIDARTLVDALSASASDARARYARCEPNGACNFIVKGRGVVTAVDTRSRVGLALVDIAPFDSRPDVSIQIGPVLRGTALRDATGLVRFTDFVNQLQFADAGNELNERVLKTVLAPLDRDKLKGRVITFAGALPAREKADPPLAELVPVKLSVEDP